MLYASSGTTVGRIPAAPIHRYGVPYEEDNSLAKTNDSTERLQPPTCGIVSTVPRPRLPAVVVLSQVVDQVSNPVAFLLGKVGVREPGV